MPSARSSVAIRGRADARGSVEVDGGVRVASKESAIAESHATHFPSPVDMTGAAERICTRCGRRLGVEQFSLGQGRCKRCRRELERARIAALRPDPEAEWRAHRAFLVERVRANLARLEKGKKPNYRGLDWLDKIEVELATTELHDAPGRDYYISGLARFVVKTE